MSIRIKSILAAAFCLLSGYNWAQAPAGFTTLCTLDENCAVGQSTLVGFGVPGHLTYRTLVGNFLCQAETFEVNKTHPNDPACYALEGGASASSSAATSSDAATRARHLTDEASVYAIVSESNGKAISVIPNPEQSNASAIVQSDFAGRRDQLWRIKPVARNYVAFTNLESEMAMAVQGWNLQEGAALQLSDWINGWNQQWRLEPLESGYFKIISRFSQQTVDVYELNNFDNGEVRTWTYWGGENQHWRLIPIRDSDAQ